MAFHPEDSALGKPSQYSDIYNPDLLFPISRQLNRDKIGVLEGQLPFYGFDIWNHYEVSWLNEKGKPYAALAEIIYDCSSPNIIESKSLKLYFNSLNNTRFKTLDEVKKTTQTDLSSRSESDVIVNIVLPNQYQNHNIHSGLRGFCIDDQDIECSIYHVDPSLLTVQKNNVAETLYSNLLKSNCLVTHQPDWASVQIEYSGQQINHESLLKYIVSFRNHNEFHEQCIERIFVDIMNQCHPSQLTVYGRFTRRGGLDINPLRSTQPISFSSELNLRLCRQ